MANITVPRNASKIITTINKELRTNYYAKYAIVVTHIGPRNSLTISSKTPKLVLEGKNNVIYK